MYPFKFKTLKSAYPANGESVPIENKYGKGYAVEVRSVFYGSQSPQAELLLLDSEGDPFIFPIHGTAMPKTVSPDVAPIVNLPISYVDSEGDNIIIVWGVVHKVGQ